MRTGLWSGFRSNSRTGLKQASCTLLVGGGGCGGFGFGFLGFFNSSRVEEEAFARLQFVAFITSTFIRVCRDTSGFFFFSYNS